MKGLELAQTRKALGLSAEEFAQDLGVSAETLRDWELGRTKIPRQKAREIAWLAAAQQRAEKLEASGLPECQWLIEQTKRLPDVSDPDALMKRVRNLEKHTRHCPTCQARERAARDTLPPIPPYPETLRDRALSYTFDILDASPAAAFVHATILVLLLIAVLWAFSFLPRWEPLALGAYLFALALAAVVGIGVLRVLSPVRQLGAMGRWLARAIAASSAMTSFVLAFRVAGFSEVLSPSDARLSWRDAITIGVIMGVAFATLWPLASRFGQSGRGGA